MALFHFNIFPAFFLLLLWIIPSAADSSGANVTDLTALLDFKKRITDDPLGIMATWNDSSNYCNWTGITCNPSNQRVQILNLTLRKLAGFLPPSIGNLSFLEGINLRFNTFRGELPQEIGLLTRLKHINLTDNMFSGSIPSNISRCTQLTILGLDNNQLSGQIPHQLSSLSELEIFGVGANNMTGTFPTWIGNLSSRFSILSLDLNSFHGGIPPEIGRLSGLEVFTVSENQFSGELPYDSIYNMSSLNIFDVGPNRLQGRIFIPPDIGLKCPNLEIFDVGMNNFTGEIPVSLTNVSRLLHVDFADNSLIGRVPSVLGRLPYLHWVNFAVNFLGSGESGDMKFLSPLTNCTNLRVLLLHSNRFGGELPGAVANLSTKLEILILGDNQMHGNLPVGMGSLVNLTVFGLQMNLFTGSIPHDFGKLQNLRKLGLFGNQLTGVIPTTFGNLTSLIELNLDRNMLEGEIPPQLGKCRSLLGISLPDNNLSGKIPKEVFNLSLLSIYLDLSGNSLSGQLPLEVSRLVHLTQLDVSRNNLSGEVPSSLSSCISLEILAMGGNQFSGAIPESLEGLRGVEVIDLSHNNLSGKMPEFLGKLPFLKKLNLSYNDLEGEVSNEGIFSNASAVSLLGNEHLCGGAPSLNLLECAKPPRNSSSKHELIRWLIPVIVCVAFLVVLMCSLSLWYILRKPKVRRDNPSPPNELLQLSYRELYRATNGFSADSLIGSGSFGSVYKGVLGGNESPVAVKVLNLELKGASRSFMEECTILKSIRHRNLLRIITACSSIDHSGQEFKCLVTDFMVNGSLDAWLHPSKYLNTTLNIMQRLKVAIDVASALDYLHNHSHTPIVHCDLKPSNILLDQDFTAHVADFGLSKFLLEAPDIATGDQSLSAQLKGSIGYIPPEYGTSTRVSTLGDVYSYGVIILELFTGKKPIDDMFNNGVSIHEHVAMALPHNVMDVVDQFLILKDEESSERRDYLAEVLVALMRIGVSCSMSAPMDRMHISSVVIQLQSMRDQMRMVRRY